MESVCRAQASGVRSAILGTNGMNLSVASALFTAITLRGRLFSTSYDGSQPVQHFDWSSEEGRGK